MLIYLLKLFSLFLQLGIKKKLKNIKQKLAAILFLGCLLLAITPKQTLHELFANHIDGQFEQIHNLAKTHLAKDSIHCHFDSIFTVNNLFTLPATTFSKPILQSFTQKIFLQTVYLGLKNNTVLLRGPPAVDDFILS